MNKFSNRIKIFSADNKLNILKKLLWFCIAFLNIQFKGRLSNKIKASNFTANIKILKKQNFSNLSPVRIICNNFWESLNWDEINNSLNNEIKFLEVGCGSGRYYEFLNKINIGKNINYFGIDIKRKNFVENAHKKFILDEAENIDKYLENVNFLFTQSAIEHFKNDLIFFNKISNHTNQIDKKFIQVHLFPSDKCLFTYLFHGYRHYNFRMISKLVKNFKNNHKLFLYGIGSNNLNKLTLKEITLKRVLNLNLKDISKEQIIKCAIKDNNFNNIKNPSFYALIILTNFNNINLHKK